ncbi:hypothetical protein N7533_005175 [Penicillium manginii]|uniref:uncharacterized protein n=1 Tax=Penicillium manginii TaxID=203109 RepID=UPI00254955B1|nr:uncharacterized protein N7533_005175 [Penicillium manginii]KAJ5755632.1 hypothetical protein N7533_005175 [Penicillium manginii]
MKLSSGFLALSALGNIAFAAPVSAPDQSPHDAGIAEAQLEKRGIVSKCQTVAKYVWIGQKTLEVTNWFYTDVEDYIKGVCERKDDTYCSSILTEVRAGFDLALKLVRKVEFATSLVGGGTVLMNLNARALPSDAYDMEALKQLHNYTIDSHYMVENPRIGARSDDATPALAHQYRLSGVRELNSNISRNYDIYHFEDGTAHLRIPGPSSGSSLQKRVDGPGVKIAFKHEAMGYSGSDFTGAATNFAYRWETLHHGGPW